WFARKRPNAAINLPLGAPDAEHHLTRPTRSRSIGSRQDKYFLRQKGLVNNRLISAACRAAAARRPLEEWPLEFRCGGAVLRSVRLPPPNMQRPSSQPRRRSRVRLAADIGGTFTDIAVFDDRTGELTFGKALSTPQRLVRGIDARVEKTGSDYRSAALFLHGSTIAINTILERTGAKTALLITEGFRDIYEIGRINRPDAYNLFFQKHMPLIERALRFEVRERVLADGEIEAPLDEAEIARLGRVLEGLGVEAIAILFLNCYARRDHE